MVLFEWLIGDDPDEQPLHQVLLIVLLLQYHNSIHDRRMLHHSAILQPQRSPWRNLFESGDESSFLHMTGLTRCAFVSLLGYIFDLEKIARHRKRGRPRSLSPHGYQGLLLFYLGSKVNYSHICLIFGITPSVCSRAINMMLK